MTNLIVEMQQISKRFGQVQALNNIDLKIKHGEIIGFLGANGSGKSTLLRHIIGLYLADKGQCLTFGTDAKKLTSQELGQIGYVHQETKLIEWMTAKQLINYVSAYYKNWDQQLQEKFISDFDIELNKRVKTLSPGQKQKLSILLAICFKPKLLILDEPASALDPIARGQFLDILLQIIQDKDRTIIISSHILSDIEKIIDRAVIMHKGKILCDSNFDQLRENFLRVTLTSLTGQLPDELPFETIINCERNNSQAILTIQNSSTTQLNQIAQNLNSKIEIESLPLEDIYKLIYSKKD